MRMGCAGARCSSGIFRLSQKTWKASIPDPYDCRVDSDQDSPITASMRCRSALEMETGAFSLLLPQEMTGFHAYKRSRASTCGRINDGDSVRWAGYGAGRDGSI